MRHCFTTCIQVNRNRRGLLWLLREVHGGLHAGGATVKWVSNSQVEQFAEGCV